MDLDEETHWGIVIFVGALAVEAAFTFVDRHSQADILLVIRPEDALVRADGRTIQSCRPAEVSLDLDGIMSLFLLLLLLLLLMIQLQRPVLEPLLPDPHDALSVLDYMRATEEDASPRAKPHQLRIGAELTEQLVGVEIQDVRDFGRPAVPGVRIDGLARLAGRRLYGRDACDPAQRHRRRHARPLGPEAAV